MASCAVMLATAAHAQTCAPAPQHALKSKLPILSSGDFWIYNVNGSITKPAVGKTAASTVPVAGTIVETVGLLPFRGKQTLAITTQADLTVFSITIYGPKVPPPKQITYLTQNPFTHELKIVGDNAGPNGSIRVAAVPAEFAPGTFSTKIAYGEMVRYVGGGSTVLKLSVGGTNDVNTRIGNFSSYSAMNSSTASDGTRMTGTLQWAPQLGAPVAFNSTTTMPNGGVTTIGATLIHSSFVKSLYPVLADNLNAPRGMAFGYGLLWLTEGGIGGPGPCIPFQGNVECYGATGRLSVLAGGKRYTIYDKFGSIAPQPIAQVSGPQGIAFAGGLPYVVIGGGGTEAERAGLGADENQTGAVFGFGLSPNGLTANPLALLSNYEYANVPDRTDPESNPAESNPFGITSVGNNVYVADAAAHTVTQVTPNGSISVVGIMPYQTVKAPDASGKLVPTFEDSVPTGIIPAPDANGFLVGDYTGYPYVKGTASVWRIAKGETPTKYASGLTNIIGVAPGPNGDVYALQQFTNGSQSGDPGGSVVQISPNGDQKTLACQGLIAPGGITTGPDGSIYVSNYATNPGYGQVVKINPND